MSQVNTSGYFTLSLSEPQPELRKYQFYNQHALLKIYSKSKTTIMHCKTLAEVVV